MAKEEQASLFVERAQVISQQFFPDRQVVTRLLAPDCARAARAGQFVHLRCSDELALRRPYSIMRVDRSAGWLEILYRVVGHGSQLLRDQPVGKSLSIIGPAGHGFDLEGCRFPLLLGGGLGMPPILFLAQQLRREPQITPLVLLASERGFPFCSLRSALPAEGFPESAYLNHQWLEEWGVAGRLCSRQSKAGCFQGALPEMAERYLSQLPVARRLRHAIFACGPKPVLQQAAALAGRWRLDCQLCLEEFMACATGACASCAVEVTTHDGRKAMRRVCVDGPVFKGQEVYPHCGA